ncbi:hypothetical protein SAMN04487786_1116 [Paenisporosarcina quisquiliarum]|nr:hypothetical protein SAMN04487786_1116 [Paenisporosarcina quisquiliarum]
MKKRFLISVGLFLGFIVIQMLLSLVGLEKWGKFFVDVAVFLLTLWILLKFIKNAIRKDIDNNLKIVRGHRERYHSLFTWLGQEIHVDYVVYDIVGDKIEYHDIMVNLKLFKKCVEEKIGNDIKDYCLLREILDIHVNKNFLSFLSEMSKILFVSLITSIITSTVVTKFTSLTNEKWDLFEFSSLIINIGLCAVFFIFALTLFYNVYNKTKNRTLVLMKVLDLIIKEKSLNSPPGQPENNI